MRRSDGGRLFQIDGGVTENAHWPRLVLVLTTDAAPLVAERRRLLLQSAFVKWTKSQRYGGQSWRCTLWTRMAILNVIRWRTGSQWSFFKVGVIWALCFRPRTRRAAVFWTRCSGARMSSMRCWSRQCNWRTATLWWLQCGNGISSESSISCGPAWIWCCEWQLSTTSGLLHQC